MVFPELTGVAVPTVLLLHAHPDDETIVTGATMARLVHDGVRVVLVTGTRGERGELVDGPLKHLEGTAGLAAVRVGELGAALDALGVSEHRWLGGSGARAGSPVDGGRLAPRVYADSGMRWGADGLAEAAPDAPPDALSLAPFDEVVSDLRAVIDEVSPTVIITYDRIGGYGHPDHVRMHEAGVEAAAATGVPVYVIVDTRGGEAAGGESEGGGDDDVNDNGSSAVSNRGSTADRERITVPLGPFRDAKLRALAAHATQLTVIDGAIVHSGGQRHPVPDSEAFARL